MNLSSDGKGEGLLSRRETDYSIDTVCQHFSEKKCETFFPCGGKIIMMILNSFT